jgi:CheY-like chemotaxis protein
MGSGHRSDDTKAVRPPNPLAELRSKILIVDDDATVRDLWKAVLARAMPHAELATAADGATALRLAQATTPDVVLMDLQMPGMSGLETTARLKAERATARVPVIAVTGAVYSVQQVLDAGCDGYLTKPVDADRLLREVGRALRVRTR